MTVYADVLFLVNFSMDLLTLYLAARITGRQPGRARMIAAAIAGGIFGTILTALEIEGIAGAVANLAVMAGMSAAAFGKSGGWIRNSLVVCGTGTLLGGIMTAILSLGEPVTGDYGSIYPSVFLGCTAAAWFFTRLFSASSARKTAEIRFTVHGKNVSFIALCDSGSFLTEPISGIPVITVAAKTAGISPEELLIPENGYRVRMIPVRTLTGNGMLCGFIPEEVTVDGRRVNAVIAPDEGKRGGYDGIVPAGLYRIHKESEV